MLVRVISFVTSRRRAAARLARFEPRSCFGKLLGTDPELSIRIEQAAQALKELGAREVYLFGSLANGRFDDDSDVDMAVSGPPPEVFFTAMAEAGGILRRPVDLVDLDRANAFTRYLKEEGELVRVG